MIAYVIGKDVLKTGIVAVDAEPTTVKGMFKYHDDNGFKKISCLHKEDEGITWFFSYPDAIGVAYDIRNRKVANLQKQIDQLNAIIF